MTEGVNEREKIRVLEDRAASSFGNVARPVDDSGKPKRKKKKRSELSPVTLRLTAEEREQLEELARA